jgi:signal transduction histidine kinase
VAGATTLFASGLALADVAYRSTSLHISLETATAVISIVAAHLVFGRFREAGALNDLLLFYAFAALAVTNLLLSAFPAALGASYPHGISTWGPALGVLAAASLLLAAAHAPARPVNRDLWRRVDRAAAAVVLAGTVGALVFLSGFGATTLRAPFAPDQWSWADLSAHPEIALQVLVSLVFLAAGFALAGRAEKTADQFLTWLAVGSVIAAFARVNYFILPSLYSHWVHVGDALRLLFYLIVLVGAAREISRYQRRAAEVAIFEERRRIARDLHDGLAQELSYIVMQTKRSASLTADVFGDRRQAEYLAAAAERALDESRRAIAALTQPLHQPLHVALAQEAGEVASRVGVELELKLDPTIKADPATCETLLRVVREAVANAGRHGHAAHISVELINGRGLRLRVVDDGDGFDLRAQTTGFGLVSMQERTKALGGRFRIASEPGRGTEVEIAIP